jgi:hypothetical protein
MNVRIHTEQHLVLNGLEDYGYAVIDDFFNVHHVLKGIKTTELDVCKTQAMASPSLYDDFSSTVELYSTFIKPMKAENPQLNVSEVSFARGKNSFGKLSSSGISNSSNTAVDDRFLENHEYHALAPDQKNTLRLKRMKRGHVGNGHGVNSNGTGKGNGKGPTIKSLTHASAPSRRWLPSLTSLACLPDDDDEYSEEEEGISNRSNADLTHQIKKKLLIPQIRMAHKYPISPWEMIHPPGGDNPVRI